MSPAGRGCSSARALLVGLTFLLTLLPAAQASPPPETGGFDPAPAPDPVVAEATQAAVLVAWVPPATVVRILIGYEVERSVAAEPYAHRATLDRATPWFADLDVTPNANHSYRVRVLTTLGPGNWSANATAAPCALTDVFCPTSTHPHPLDLVPGVRDVSPIVTPLVPDAGEAMAIALAVAYTALGVLDQDHPVDLPLCGLLNDHVCARVTGTADADCAPECLAAASVAGDARCRNDLDDYSWRPLLVAGGFRPQPFGCVAASAQGDADCAGSRNHVFIPINWDVFPGSTGCAAASGTGDAACATGPRAAGISGASAGVPCAAATAFGDASCRSTAVRDEDLEPWFVGVPCVALSVFGSAECAAEDPSAGCAAVSVLSSARSECQDSCVAVGGDDATARCGGPPIDDVAVANCLGVAVFGDATCSWSEYGCQVVSLFGGAACGEASYCIAQGGLAPLPSCRDVAAPCSTPAHRPLTPYDPGFEPYDPSGCGASQSLRTPVLAVTAYDLCTHGHGPQGVYLQSFEVEVVGGRYTTPYACVPALIVDHVCS